MDRSSRQSRLEIRSAGVPGCVLRAELGDAKELKLMALEDPDLKPLWEESECGEESAS